MISDRSQRPPPAAQAKDFGAFATAISESILVHTYECGVSVVSGDAILYNRVEID